MDKTAAVFYILFNMKDKTFEKWRQAKKEAEQIEREEYEQKLKEEELLQQMIIENYDFEHGNQKY